MEIGQIDLGIFSLVGVIMLVMAATSFFYLLSVKDKSNASRLLQWFFLCIMLSATATVLTNLGTDWSWAFAPSQDAFLILGGVFLARFAYTYPAQDRSKKARWIARVFDVLAAAALGYSAYFAFAYLANLPAQIEESSSYYLLTPVAIVGIILVLFRRSLSLSRQEIDPPIEKQHASTSPLSMLIHPRGLPAAGLRNLGLALSIGLLPIIVFLLKPIFPPPIGSFFFNFGVVMAISAVMLVYLNHAPEPTTITAKLVGISLVTIQLLLGMTCISLLIAFPELGEHRIVSIFIPVVIVSSLLILILFPIFFQSTLYKPMARLMEGVRQVNRGKLDLQLEVIYDDEMGYITRSFNRMVQSIAELTDELQDRAGELEARVSERTSEIRDVNEQLIQEIENREAARNRLDQQLRYEKALAGCSQMLLVGSREFHTRQDAIVHALAELREGVDASRAYVIRYFIDSESVERVGIFAESCAPGINPHMPNPENQRIPLSSLPEVIPEKLRAGDHLGGPTKQLFDDHPWAEILTSQISPLHSLLLFPIHLEGIWWGFVGFDDCVGPRQWNDSEVLFLRTASEMIGSAIQRWQVQEQLLRTLEGLEVRVEERTQSLTDSNAELRGEIRRRAQLQEDLEGKLYAERILSRVSAKLVTSDDLEGSLEDILGDFVEMVRAEHVSMLLFDTDALPGSNKPAEWHSPSSTYPSPEFLQDMLAGDPEILALLSAHRMVFLNDDRQITQERLRLSESSPNEENNAWILVPLFNEEELRGVLAICNSALDSTRFREQQHAFDVFSNLLTSKIQRDQLLRTLEVRIAEQAHELSTLYEMAMLSGDVQTLSDILYPALTKVQEINKSEAVCIHLLSSDHERLSLAAQGGVPTEYHAALEEILIQEDFVHWLADPQTRHGLESGLLGSVPDQLCFPGFRSFMISKLRAGGSIRGIVSCYRESDQPYTSFQISIMEVVGDLLGVVVENYFLTREAEKLATVHERQRLARELHDAVSQSLYSLTLFARSARDAFDEDEEVKLVDSLEQLERNAQSALREMRLLLYQLRAIALEEQDLAQAIEARFNMVERRLGIRAKLEVDDKFSLSPGMEQELFRIISEALNNSLHHASAKQVSVRMRHQNGQIMITVNDDGIGFIPAEARTGMGLQNMRERASEMDGELEITSRPDHGTQVQLLVPSMGSLLGEAQ